MNYFKELLEWYYEQGFNLIPIPVGKKGAIIEWKQFQEEKAPRLPENWEENIAVILGKTSGNLIDIDCDSKELLDLMIKILPDTMATKSFRGGHLYYRPDFMTRKFTLDLGNLGKLEVAGQGQISILPPSLHEKGIHYEFINKKPPAFWHGDFKQELTELLENKLNVKIKREAIDVEQILKGAPEGERDESAIRLATWYRLQGKDKDETLKLMLEWNERNQPPLEESIIQRKVDSAWTPEKPYSYNFPKKKIEKRQSCGMDLESIVFEQVGEEFIVFDKETGEITRRKSVEGYEPFTRVTWKYVDDLLPYESEQKLWDEVHEYLWEHIDIPTGYDVLTAWVLASWTLERWHAVPYLFFYGPPGSGKTWALEVLASIGFRPFMTASTTLSSIFRACDHWHPTIFLDETEAYMKKERGEIMHLLNSGYRRDFPATRVEDTERGLEIRIFDCFGFKALAGTREFAQALKSRCIIFNMSKATRKIKTIIDPEKAERLRKMLLAYRFKMLSKKEKEQPTDIFSGRLKELFDPLIIVAPPTAKSSIIAEAKKIEEITKEEEQASDEARVFRAIFFVYQQTQEKKLTIEEITKVVNEPLSPDEMLTNVYIGRIASRLGFKATLKNRKRAIFWNQEIGERLVRRYLTEKDIGGLTAFSEKVTD